MLLSKKQNRREKEILSAAGITTLEQGVILCGPQMQFKNDIILAYRFKRLMLN